jgi:hypothetical protein
MTRLVDQRDRDNATVEPSTLELALLSIGTQVDSAVMTAITPIAYQSRMSSAERRGGRLRLRMRHPLVDFPHAQNSDRKPSFRIMFFQSTPPN